MASVLSVAVLEELGALKAFSAELAAAEDVGAAASAVADCIVATLGPDAPFALWVGGGTRTLEPAWRSNDAELARPAERRAAFRSERPARLRKGERGVALLPLVCRAEAVGLLEVAAPAHRLDDTWEILETIVGPLAVTLHGLARPSRSERRDEAEGDLDLAIAWTAHELRGPLSALRASLEFLRVHDAPSEHAPLLDRCVVEIDHMSGLVDDVLRVGSGAELPPADDCDVTEAVRQAIDESRLQHGAERIILDSPRRVLARVEPVQIRSAVGNLIRNALAYSPAHSPVTVAVALEDHVLSIAVRNAGRAVSGDDGDTDAIFRPYVRGSNAQGRSGRGLGLFIARRVAEANGGRLTLRLEDQATQFVLEIPRGA
ncbi:MAG TPA: HAMP domain-containing sensor histidine kinase [Actinomycetota bacterium]|nr:HAMP domain-containing sensor histidine kinase [Actinomycetota bacterium]